MMTGAADRRALEALDARLRTLLPEEYRDSYEDVQPISMGSAGLKYDADGQVAWDQMWGSFCDLAMAGGPPHKGTLLEPGSEAEIDAQFDRYDEVAEEICRGISMATGLRSYVSPTPGWVSRGVPRRRDGRLAGSRDRHGECRRTPSRRDSRTAGGAAFPPREGNQERRHRHRQDVSLLAGPHAARAAAGGCRAVRDDGRGIAADRARSVESRGANRDRDARRERGCSDSPGHRPSAVEPSLRRAGSASSARVSAPRCG